MNIGVLKAQLAKYLRMVKEGEEVVVYDRNLAVAKMVPVSAEAEAAFLSLMPTESFSAFTKMKIKAPKKKPKKDSLTLLLEDRGSR